MKTQINSKKQTYLLYICFFIILSSTLFAGLYHKTSITENKYVIDNNGITFLDNAMIYSNQFLEKTALDQFNQHGYKLELDITMPKFKGHSMYLLDMPNQKKRTDNFIIWQWQQHIIVMNGNDFDSKRKEPKLLAKLAPGNYTITVIATKNKSQLFVNNRLVNEVDAFISLPRSLSSGKISLGNSSRRANSWTGSINVFSLRNLNNNSTQISYKFNQNNIQQNAFKDTYQIGGDIVLEKYPKPLIQDYFIEPIHFKLKSKEDRQDVLLNIFGFIPIAFVMMMLYSRNDQPLIKATIKTLCLGILLSFFIEYTQGWIPSRTSSYRDLTLNSISTALGIGLFYLYLQLHTKIIQKQEK